MLYFSKKMVQQEQPNINQENIDTRRNSKPVQTRSALGEPGNKLPINVVATVTNGTT